MDLVLETALEANFMSQLPILGLVVHTSLLVGDSKQVPAY